MSASTKKTCNVRISAKAFEELEALCEALHVPKSSIVAIAISRMHAQEDLVVKKPTKKTKRSRGANHSSV